MAMAFRPQPSPCSIRSRNGSHSLVARSRLRVGGEIGWPKSVVTSLAGFASEGLSVTSLAAFASEGVGGHLVGRFCRCSPSPASRWSYRDPRRLQVSACCFSTYTSGLLDAPQGPSELP